MNVSESIKDKYNMNNDISFAYSEVDSILDQMEEEYVNRIPLDIRKIIKEEKNKEYNPIIVLSEDRLDKELNRNTIAILAWLNLNYWCDNEEEKGKLIEIYKKNDIINEEEKREKYPIDIFKNNNGVNNRNKKEEKEENPQTNIMINKKDNFIIKLLRKIKGIIHKRRINNGRKNI